MGLSPDPQKRDRQLANLRKGWATNAARLNQPPPAVPEATEPAPGREPEPEPDPEPAGKPELEVIPYDADPEPAPNPDPKPEPRRRRERQPRPEPEPEPAAEERGGILSELARGFLGG